ncbi:MAG: YdeI/OmpD-associated family protein [Actinobacteria bacterium]|nr:YdeI/OmpD-associated family protein [Actinomycetota bacterium]
MQGPDGKLIKSFRDRSSWAAWLEKNHAASPGVWLRLAKKSSNLRSVSYGDAVEVALCYGWIDGQAKGEDENHSLQKFTPRAKRSIWSKRNREKAVALIDSGRMKPAGLTAIERAKQDGRWMAAYDSPSTVKVPRDFQAALNEEARAKEFFKTLDARNRYAMLFQIQTAKRPDTRARRIRKYVAMLAREEKLYP